MEQPNVRLEAMTEESLDDVLKIQKESFGKESRSDFLNCISRSEVYSYFVLVDEKKNVSGYYGTMNISGDGELLTIAVKTEHRGKGYGELMLRSAVLSAALKGSTKMFLEVDETNKPAIGLYAKFGFVPISKREKYYGENAAIIMEYDIEKNAK